MNLLLDSHDFPTTYYSVADIAAWVSTVSIFIGVRDMPSGGSRARVLWSEGARVLRMKDTHPSAGRTRVLVPVGRTSCCS